MGLLDGTFGITDPRDQEAARMAILAASLGMLSGRGRNFGEIAGNAGMQGMGAYAMTREGQRRQAEMEMQRKLNEAHMGLYNAQADKEKFSIEEKKRMLDLAGKQVPPWQQQAPAAAPSGVQLPPDLQEPQITSLLQGFSDANMAANVRGGQLFVGNPAPAGQGAPAGNRRPVDPVVREMLAQKQREAQDEWKLAQAAGDIKGMKAAEAKFMQALTLKQDTTYATPNGMFTPPRLEAGMHITPQGTVSPLPGFVDSSAAIKGAQTGADEDARAARQIVTVNRPDNTSVQMTQAQRLRELGAGPAQPGALPGAAPAATQPAGNEIMSPSAEAGAKEAQVYTFGKYIPEITKSAQMAQHANATIRLQEQALDAGLRTGWGTEVKGQVARILGAFGVKDAANYATNVQTFVSGMKEQVLNKQLAQLGPQTESDARRMEETVASLGNTPEAARFIIAFSKAANDRIVEKANFALGMKGATYVDIERAWAQGPGNKSLFDNPALQGAVRNYGSANTEARATSEPPPAAVEFLRANQNDPAVRKAFKDKYGVDAMGYMR